MGFDAGLSEIALATAAASTAAESAAVVAPLAGWGATTAFSAGAGAADLIAGTAAASAPWLSASQLAYAGLGSSLLSGGVSALGALKSADATAKNADYQAKVAKNNELIAGQQANQAAEAGASAEERQGMRARALAGQIEASEAANNVDVNTGSNKAVQTSQDELNALDAATIRHNTAMQVYGYNVGRQSSGAQASLLEQQARDAGPAGIMSAGGSLLSAAGNATNQYYNWMRVSGSSNKNAVFP